MAHTTVNKRGRSGKKVQVQSGRCHCGEQPMSAYYELEIRRGMESWGTAEFERHLLDQCVHYKQVDAHRIEFLERVEAAARAHAEWVQRHLHKCSASIPAIEPFDKEELKLLLNVRDALAGKVL